MNSIKVYKFLLPVSVLLLAIGAAIFFLGYFPVFGIGSNFGPTIGVIFTLCLALGFIFLIVSLIDMSLVRKRAVQTGQENVEPHKIYKILKEIGKLIITIVVLFFLLIIWILSGY